MVDVPADLGVAGDRGPAGPGAGQPDQQRAAARRRRRSRSRRQTHGRPGRDPGQRPRCRCLAERCRPRLFERFATGAARAAPAWGCSSCGSLRARTAATRRYEPDRRVAGRRVRPRAARADERDRSRRARRSWPSLEPCRSGSSSSTTSSDVRRLVRTALRFRRGFEVVGEAGDGAEAVRLARTLHPDVVVLDLGPAGPRRAGGAQPDSGAGSARLQGRRLLRQRDRTTSVDRRARRRATSLKDAELDYLVDLLESVGRRGSRGGRSTCRIAEQRQRGAEVRRGDRSPSGGSSRCSTTRCWSRASSRPTR